MGVSLNLVPKGDPNGNSTEKRDYELNKSFNDVFTKWGQMTIAIHGNEKGVYINHRSMKIEDLAKMIKENPRYEEAKKEAKQKGRKMEILLLACNTGQDPGNGELPVGQKLANALADEDVYVSAPDKYVVPCKLDSLSPGYELSKTGAVKTGQRQEPRIFKKFEYTE